MMIQQYLILKMYGQNLIYDTTPIDVITQTNLEFRMIHSEGDSKNNNSQWIFPDENLNAQAGNYLLTVSQTHKLYLVSVFYITQ